MGQNYERVEVGSLVLSIILRPMPAPRASMKDFSKSNMVNWYSP